MEHGDGVHPVGHIAGIAMQDKRGAVRLGRRNKPGVQPSAVVRLSGA